MKTSMFEAEGSVGLFVFSLYQCVFSVCASTFGSVMYIDVPIRIYSYIYIYMCVCIYIWIYSLSVFWLRMEVLGRKNLEQPPINCIYSLLLLEASSPLTLTNHVRSF